MIAAVQQCFSMLGLKPKKGLIRRWLCWQKEMYGCAVSCLVKRSARVLILSFILLLTDWSFGYFSFARHSIEISPVKKNQRKRIGSLIMDPYVGTNMTWSLKETSWCNEYHLHIFINRTWDSLWKVHLQSVSRWKGSRRSQPRLW